MPSTTVDSITTETLCIRVKSVVVDPQNRMTNFDTLFRTVTIFQQRQHISQSFTSPRAVQFRFHFMSDIDGGHFFVLHRPTAHFLKTEAQIPHPF